MTERFAKPCVGAILERVTEGRKQILLQTRWKEDGCATNGLLELPAGKLREYEDVFSALRREVWEETGLTVTEIVGEDSVARQVAGGHETLSFTPYCTTQNLSGAYSILLHTFLARAEGEPLEQTNETKDICWRDVEEVRELLRGHPERFFFMHVNALGKYLGLLP